MKSMGLLVLWLMCAPLAVQANATQPDKYAGYQVDGRATASVLSAKRSHSVRQQGEMGLIVFSAIFTIGTIIFAASLLGDRDK